MAKPKNTPAIRSEVQHILTQLLPRTPPRNRQSELIGILWRSVVGEFLEQHSRPLHLKDKALHVRVTSNLVKDQLLRMERPLIKRLRTESGLHLDKLIVDDRMMARILPPSPDPPTPSPELTPTTSCPPPVREELRTVIHRIWAKDQRHKLGKK